MKEVYQLMLGSKGESNAVKPTQFLFPVLNVWVPRGADVVLIRYTVSMLPSMLRASHYSSEELNDESVYNELSSSDKMTESALYGSAWWLSKDEPRH